MTREEAIKEIEKAFEPAFANYIITALTEGATVSDKEPFKPMVEIDLDYVIKQKYVEREVLDKIRDEIKAIAFDWQEIDGEHESFMVVDLNDALNIIDKYKAESEE